jgi:hypothetical protein
MAVNLETNFTIFLNQQLKINRFNNLKFVVNNTYVHLCYVCSIIYIYASCCVFQLIIFTIFQSTQLIL